MKFIKPVRPKIKTVRTKFFLVFILCIIIPWVVFTGIITIVYTTSLREKYISDTKTSLERSLSSFGSEVNISTRYLDMMFTSEILNPLLNQRNFESFNFSYKKASNGIDNYLLSLVGNDEFISGAAIFIDDKPISSVKFTYWGSTIQESHFFEQVKKANGGIVFCENMLIKDEYLNNREFMLIGRQLKKIEQNSTSSVIIQNEPAGIAVLMIDIGKILGSFKSKLSTENMRVALFSNNKIICSEFEPEILFAIQAEKEQWGENDSVSQLNGSFKSKASENDLILYAKIPNLSYTAYSAIDYKNVYNSFDYMKNVIFAFQLLCIIAFIAFTCISQTMIAAPIKKIEAAMENVTKGNFDTIVNTKTNDEFERMGNSFNYMVNKIKEMIEQIHSNYKVQNEMEISMLQYQVNPHFIYNILSSIRMKALMVKDNEVAQMLQKVSRLFSRTIGKSGKNILFSEEISNLEDYVFIHKNIFSNQINVNFNISIDTLSCIVPNMLLQPIVENCFVHGACEGSDNFCILIKAVLNESDLIVTVSDDGVGIDDDTIKLILSEDTRQSQDFYNKIGVNSVNKRLKLRYGDSYGVFIDSKVGCFTKVTIKIPAEYGEAIDD